MSFNLVNLQQRDGTLKRRGKKWKKLEALVKNRPHQNIRLDMTYMFYKYVFNIMQTA